MKILIVDDDRLNRKVLSTMLHDAGFETVQATDGLEALKALENDNDIKVILLDRMMPNMDGMEFMREFSKRAQWVYKKVIMQTAANQPKDVIEGKSTGAYYYLTKPFDSTILLSVVRAAIDDINKMSGA